jgi:Mrp family chromosome partitioning ATPase
MGTVSFLDLEKERRRKDLTATLARIGKKFLVMSGKGGVGKTTLAVNLAAALAARGRRTGLLDIDLHGPSVAGALGLDRPLAVGADGKLRPAESGPGLKVVTIQGLLPNRDEAVIWRGPKKIAAIRQFLSETAWDDLDFLIIDSPPGTGDEPMAVLEAIDDLRPLMVTSGHRLAIDDAAKAFNFLKAMRRRPAGLIDNQSYFVCPRCGGGIDIYNREAARALAERAGAPLLASLPLDLEAARAAEEGRPLVWSRPGHPFSLLMAELAEKLQRL